MPRGLRARGIFENVDGTRSAPVVTSIALHQLRQRRPGSVLLAGASAVLLLLAVVFVPGFGQLVLVHVAERAIDRQGSVCHGASCPAEHPPEGSGADQDGEPLGRPDGGIELRSVRVVAGAPAVSGPRQSRRL